MHLDYYIGPKVRHLNTLLRQRVELSEQGLPRGQQFTLGYLALHKDQPVYPKDLEEVFSLTHPTVSGILRRLEEGGYVRLVTEESDRRRRRVCITEKALERESAIQETIARTEAQALQDFTDEEKKLFSQMLARAIRNMGGIPCHFIPKEEPKEHD